MKKNWICILLALISFTLFAGEKDNRVSRSLLLFYSDSSKIKRSVSPVLHESLIGSITEKEASPYLTVYSGPRK